MFWKIKKGEKKEGEDKVKKGKGKEKKGEKDEKKPERKEPKAEEKRTGLETRRKRTLRNRIFGKLWFRLDYYDERSMKLDDYKQTVFLESYMNSTRQLNRSLILILFFMIIVYIIYALQILNIAEVIAAWIILVYLLFYLARRHRNENEKLLEHLLDAEMTPEYIRKR
jgi:hypothetical protein